MTEAGAEFTKPLSDQTVIEFESVSFECEVSKPNLKSKWFKDGVELKNSDRVEIKSKDKRHFLSVHKCQLDDTSAISIKIENVESTAQLTVKGEDVKPSPCRLVQ